MRTLGLLLLFCNVALLAQKDRHFNVVAPTVPGRVVLPPAGADWQLSQVGLYDDDTRPVVSFQNTSTHVMLSVLLYPNTTGKPTAESCRDAVLSAILSSMREHSTLEDQKRESSTSHGMSFATARYLIAKAGNIPVRDENVFGFFGTAATCAEIHLSKVRYTAADAVLIDGPLAEFSFDAAYKPTPEDYSTLGSLFYSSVQDYASSAVYYQRALDTLAAGSGGDYRRYVTDQLGMSLGQSGKIDQARKVFNTAIAADPKYPMYYYNLAAADAEQGDAAGARTHLQQAFDRRTDLIQGESLPDPAEDGSFQKLKSNADFWSFVTGLSRQLSQ